MGKFGKRRSGPWYAEDRERIIFEARSREFFPTLKRGSKHLGRKNGLGYLANIEVPFYESRSVEIFFSSHGSGDNPTILSDGPTDSTHRFADFERRHLCVWHPDDPPDRRWMRADGLLALLGQIKLHLFREAWYRETGEWPGPQAPHSSRNNGKDHAA